MHIQIRLPIPRAVLLRANRFLAAILGSLLALSAVAAAGPGDEGRTFMRFPTLHGDSVVFEAHGNLWRVSRSGGPAARLTSEPGYELMPRYSPDGKWIAFTGQYQGNRDVYVIPAEGGAAQRLTFHSDVVEEAPQRWGPDNMVVSWTPDSANVVYLSRREAWNSWYGRLFSVPVAGGPSQALPLDRGGLISYSPDGRQIAYNRIFRNFRTWKRYEGGLAQDIDIYDFASKTLTHLTDWPGTETAPMWYGETIYFLADHDAARRANIWAYDFKTRAFRQVTHFTDYDVDFPSLGDSGITFQQGGSLYVLDLPSEQLHKLEVRVPDDGVHTAPRFVDGKKFIREVDAAQINDFDLAPNGKRALLVVRGDLFSIPAEHGSTRNITQTPGVDEDHPAWSPDGKLVAYTTDATGEQQLAVRPAMGGEERVLTHFTEGFFYQPVWAPGGDRLAFSDNEHRLWIIALAGGEPQQIAQDRYQEMHDYNWSPDGRWLAYSITDANQVRALWLYSLESGKATRVSAGRDNDTSPAFDPEGHYLYFISSRHENPVLSEAEFDAANLKSSGIYAVTLAADGTGPFAPRSDEGAFEEEHDSAHADAQSRKATGAGEAAGAGSRKDRASSTGEGAAWKPGASAPIRIDLEGLMRRATPLPVPAAVITSLDVRKGRVYYLTTPLPMIEGKLPGEKAALHSFDSVERKDAIVVDDLDGYRLSADGKKVLYRKEKDWFIVDAMVAPEGAPKAPAAKKQLDLSHLRLRVDPSQEWREMFESAWRLERDFYFNRPMNGTNWAGIHASYAKLLPLVGSREDLVYLLGEVQGELGNSHTYAGGGDQDNPTVKVPTGLLGVDFSLDAASGRYFFSRIYGGDNTREAYRSPLAQPGIKAKAGDYLLAVEGQELKAPADPYSVLVGHYDQAVRLTLADTPTGARREVLVEPLRTELKLRELAWIEHNREKVSQLSDGRIGYVYLSDMESVGMEQFIRQFFNQIDKQALVVDVRWNGGGFIDQIVLERLRRVLAGMSTDRARNGLPIPQQLVAGPKACLINHYSASDGDLFPFYFRKYGLGPLIGTRTWGGVRGIRGYWPMLDGGYVTIPEDSVYGLDSQWVMENRGVAPDIEVDDSPGELLAGHDPQLEASVNYLLKELAKKPGGLPAPPPPLPAYPPPGHE